MAANDKPVTGDRVRSPERISDYDLDNNRGETAIVTERSEAVGLARTRKESPTSNFSFIYILLHKILSAFY
jgi:hypothetical protein